MANTKKPTSDIALSVIITTHAEGILLHKTLASVRRALKPLHDKHVSSEIIIHADDPSPATQEYLGVHRQALADTRIFINHFGDLGLSRNFAVQKAHGTYVTFIDADDLMSREWLVRAHDFLEAHAAAGEYVAHSESTVEFGGIDAVVIKHGAINQATDTLLAVYANRWNSIIMAPRELLLSEPYTSNSPGFGYEDWNLNCRLIGRSVHNVLIPGTAIFVRRKDGQSEWLRQRQVRAVLAKNPTLGFANIRALEHTLPLPARSKARASVLKLVRSLPSRDVLARKLYAAATRLRKATRRTVDRPLPDWLIDEWQAMHTIDKSVFLSEELRAQPPYYDSLTPEHYQAGAAYKQLVDRTRQNHYDYLLFVPWLKHGGADRFAINYANSIARLRPEKHVAVIATLAADSPWQSQLDPAVDFIPFGEIAKGLSNEVRYRLLEQFIENSGAPYLHLINSELAYDFVRDHKAYIEASGKTVVASSFSQSTDSTGRVFGYSHTHVPAVYELLTAITTDNQAVTRMWVNEYGFDPAKLLVHHLPVDLPALPALPPPTDHSGPLRVLWAARLSPEKQPELVAQIGQLVQARAISIDMYGVIDTGFNADFLRKLPKNMHYLGGFNDFYALPLQNYDAYLYTSVFDGMPNAILEAAAAQLPIVSSAVGGIPDLIEDRQSGFLVQDLTDPTPYAHALEQLATNVETRRQYGANLHQKLLQLHNPAAYQKEIAELLTKLGY
ncbi:MAG TPA: glycosyltransferase [Candidatus Saccharimonadales bacterium]|nr:glycosyltransferase [Candidatus Saccharimonadales bacterium]